MGKSKAPKAPDYAAAAQQTAAGNLANLQYQTEANRPTINTPWGSETWTQGQGTFDQAGYDRAVQQQRRGGTAPDRSKFYGSDGKWTQNINLSPAEQEALTSQQHIQKDQSALAGQLRSKVGEMFSHDFQAPGLASYTSGLPSVNSRFAGFDGTGAVPQYDASTAQAGVEAAYKSAMGLIQPQQQQDTKHLDETLRLQGLQPGTEAYNNASQNLGRVQAQQNDQIANQAVQTGNDLAQRGYAATLAGVGQDYSQALGAYGANTQAQELGNQAVGQGYAQAKDQYSTNYQEAMQRYLQPLNSFNAVLTGQQVQNPVFNGPNSTAGYTPGADLSGAAQLTGQYNSAAAAAQNASAGGIFGTLGGVASAGIMAY